MTRSRRTKLSVLAVTALVALTGCSTHTGSAAVVAADSISHQQVDDLAAALCSANLGSAKAQGQPAPSIATRGARQGALQVLLDSDINRQFGESKGVKPNEQQVSLALKQNEQGINLVAPARRDTFRTALKEYAEGQLMLLEIGRASLEQQGKTGVSDDQAIAEGNRLRAKYVNGIDVSVDPRYGTFTGGEFKAEGSSLSVAVSGRAKAGDTSDPSDAWVAALPASQKCS